MNFRLGMRKNVSLPKLKIVFEIGKKVSKKWKNWYKIGHIGLKFVKNRLKFSEKNDQKMLNNRPNKYFVKKSSTFSGKIRNLVRKFLRINKNNRKNIRQKFFRKSSSKIRQKTSKICQILPKKNR